LLLLLFVFAIFSSIFLCSSSFMFLLVFSFMFLCSSWVFYSSTSPYRLPLFFFLFFVLF
jgi:hypothetical protein